MQRVVVIANPVASQFTGGSHRDVMSQLAKYHDVHALWPGSAVEATAAAQGAVDEGASIVVAMGGDGIVHHVAQALVGTETALGIVPTGTTNVVARLFDIPARTAKATKLIARPHQVSTIGTARLDLVRGDTTTTHHAIFACGFGLDAEVVRAADSDPYRKYRFGSIHYARSALRVGLASHAGTKPHVTFVHDARTATGTSALIQFRQVYTYFGRVGLRFIEQPPEPMTVLVMERLRRRRIPSIMFNALSHRDLDRIKGFTTWEHVERLELDADPPVAAQADGEGLGLVDGGSVEWAPDSLRIVSG